MDGSAHELLYNTKKLVFRGRECAAFILAATQRFITLGLTTKRLFTNVLNSFVTTYVNGCQPQTNPLNSVFD